MERLSKRVFDVTAAAAALALFAPIIALLALGIRLEDGAPMFFAQQRLGRGRRPFTILKLRTLREGRVTRVGRWLRATGLDELPQLVNVLRGEMSLVGPRPLTEADIARLGWEGPRYDYRFCARPGIAGLAQLFAGHSARLSRRLERLALRHDSLLFDVRMVAWAFAVNLIGKRRLRWLLRRRY